ncbi:MAG: outer membrane lipoprotein chaperone LolA [Magnetococcus sp. MYC-9]
MPLTCLAAQPPAEAGGTMTAPVKRLQDFLNKIKSMEAEFVQRIESPEAGIPAESSGHIATAKPGRFRWDYRTPAVQTLVSDGRTLWFYEPDLAQVTVSPATRLENTPALLLSSNQPLQTIFTWQTGEDEQLQLPSVRLLPRKAGTIKEIVVVLDPDRDVLLKLTTHDSLGHVSHFTFQGMSLNQPIAKEHFQFKIPPNVDIIEDRASANDPP